MYAKVALVCLGYWTTKVKNCYRKSGVRYALVMKLDERAVDLAVFFGERNPVALRVVGDLHMAASAFEFLEMVGDKARHFKPVPENRTQQPPAQRVLPVSY
jgi:hypothetical protein